MFMLKWVLFLHSIKYIWSCVTVLSPWQNTTYKQFRGRLILPQTCWDFSLWVACSIAVGLRKKPCDQGEESSGARDQMLETSYVHQNCVPSDSLLPSSLRLLSLYHHLVINQNAPQSMKNSTDGVRTLTAQPFPKHSLSYPPNLCLVLGSWDLDSNPNIFWAGLLFFRFLLIFSHIINDFQGLPWALNFVLWIESFPKNHPIPD